ncbi:hypothetical protein Micbo1qcDRAFT_224815 [Microdochium bolleyi]|uniref:Uncharacterized protein n=1 Tax=Microdochium bolleyi TaxID=196109 RepID=A0A136IJQ0_9PEZI|nr:hypothetical protein Micbo1qcDRAFT_224815 [Microdochium bolleyi]
METPSPHHLHLFCGVCTQDFTNFDSVVIGHGEIAKPSSAKWTTHRVDHPRQQSPCREINKRLCLHATCQRCPSDCQSVTAHLKCYQTCLKMVKRVVKEATREFANFYTWFMLRTRCPWGRTVQGLRPSLPFQARYDKAPYRVPLNLQQRITDYADPTYRRIIYALYSLPPAMQDATTETFPLRQIRSWKPGSLPETVDADKPKQDLLLTFDWTGLVEITDPSTKHEHDWNDLFLYQTVSQNDPLQDSEVIFYSRVCLLKTPPEFDGKMLLWGRSFGHQRPQNMQLEDSFLVIRGIPLLSCGDITFLYQHKTSEIMQVHIHTKDQPSSEGIRVHMERQLDTILGANYIPLSPINDGFKVVKWDQGGFSRSHDPRKDIQVGEKGLASKRAGNPTLLLYRNQCGRIRWIDLASNAIFDDEHTGLVPIRACVSLHDTISVELFLLTPLEKSAWDPIQGVSVVHEDGSRSAVGSCHDRRFDRHRVEGKEKIQAMISALDDCKHCGGSDCISSLRGAYTFSDGTLRSRDH